MAEATFEAGRHFQCSLCPSSFYRKSHLTEHIRSHLKEKLFACNECSYTAYKRSHLARHVRAVHKKRTTFKCSFEGCSYSTAETGDLKKHRHTHDTDPLKRRPFPCGFSGCDYRATQKSCLTRHIQRRHNENRAKTFGCTLCPATFYERFHLRQHISGIHVKEAVYSCSKCHYKSWRQGDVNKHMRTLHCDEIDDGRADEPSHGPPATVSTEQEMNIGRSGNVMSSNGAGLERIPSADYMEMPVDEDDVGDDPNYIYQYELCNYSALNKKEALTHSKVHKVPSASST